jgi:hypothetical protein
MQVLVFYDFILKKGLRMKNKSVLYASSLKGR